LPSKEVLAERWARFLRLKYPPRDTAKHIMRDFNCEPRTATAWLSAHNPPHICQLARAGQLFGPVAVAAVLFPDTCFYLKADIHEALASVEARIETIRQRLGDLDAR
jgi:hypothetical protein